MTMRRAMLLRVLMGALVLAAAQPALADAADAMRDQLEADGYRSIQIERTLLGRIRITAEQDDHRREIVIDPSTGVILRDLREERAGGEAAAGDG